uniref:Three-finger toxin n=1 Tax=Calliophis bivirgatus TaxID=8633 RepID=A0A898IL83_CALBG|nr:three-finger toxin [Calliophis bivirgatus]
MKTLLLTLVVLTIMCLDLGYTMQCYHGGDLNTIKTCDKRDPLCFKKLFNNPFFKAPKTLRGCASRCPPDYDCCSTDLCNA